MSRHQGVTTTGVMGERLLKEVFIEGEPRKYYYNPDFSWDFNVKGPLDIILPLKKHRNPVGIDAALILDPSLPIPSGMTQKKRHMLAELRESYQWSMGRRFEMATLNTAEKLAEILIPLLAPLHVEHFAVIPTNPRLQALAAPNLVARGDVDGTDAPIRSVLRAVLKSDGVGFFIAHNHPSGNTEPSPADIVVTRRIASAAQAVDLRLHDHLIIGPPASWLSIRNNNPSAFII